jgi:hypothetical protein
MCAHVCLKRVHASYRLASSAHQRMCWWSIDSCTKGVGALPGSKEGAQCFPHAAMCPLLLLLLLLLLFGAVGADPACTV